MKKYNSTIALSLVFTLILVNFACNDKNKKTGLDKKGVEVVVPTDSVLLLSAENQFGIFYSFLEKSDYQACVKMFKSELLTSPGEESLKNGLSQRNQTMGVPQSFALVYNYMDFKTQSDTVFYFIIRVFNKNGGMCYEKVGLEKTNKEFFIGLYEYSPVPYYDINSANDTRSELYKAIAKMYKEVNSKNYDAILKLVDQNMIESQGKAKIQSMLEEQFKSYLKINDFVVKSVSVDFIANKPQINLVLEVEDEKGEVFTENLGFVDNLGSLKIIQYKRLEKVNTSSSGEVELSKDEYGHYKKEAGNFYTNLSSGNYDAIMSKIDKSVFQNNDFNSIKNSFVSRNEYYGTPLNQEKTRHEIKAVNGIIIVDFYFDVSNSKGIKSYEKVSIACVSNKDYRLYGYDYSDKPL